MLEPTCSIIDNQVDTQKKLNSDHSQEIFGYS